MGTSGVPFFDYYEFLGLESDADVSPIRAAIQRWRARNDRDRVHPDLMRDVDRREHRLMEAEAMLLDPSRRRAYDEAYRRHIAQQDIETLWLYAAYQFEVSDPEPAPTVHALARKLDDDWPRAIAAVKNGSVEQNLHYNAPRQQEAHRQRFAAMEQEIKRLRMTLGELYPYQMLESVIVLCDARLPHADGQVNGQPLDGATLPALVVRPDQPQTARFRLERATNARGCLFGQVRVEDAWATVAEPQPKVAIANGPHKVSTMFELVGNGYAEVALNLPAAGLLTLPRPQTHPLHIAIELQPDTAHQRIAHCTLPVVITPIPAKAAFEPAQVTLPVTRRGQTQTVTVRLVNKGESPLNARRARTIDPDLTVSDSLDSAGGEVTVTVKTGTLPYGRTFQKMVNYTADGDTPTTQLQIEGELLPTPWQHVFRLQPARDRLTLASVFALFALMLSTIMAAIIQPPVALWVVLGIALAGGAAWVARSVAHSAVRHINGAGNDHIMLASVRWNVVLLGAGGGAAVIALIVALLPLEPWQKTYILISLVALLAAAWGAIYDEDLAVYPRKPRVGSRAPEEKPHPLSNGWKSTTAIAMVAGIIISLVVNTSLAAVLLWWIIPLGIVLMVLAAAS